MQDTNKSKRSQQVSKKQEKPKKPRAPVVKKEINKNIDEERQEQFLLACKRFDDLLRKHISGKDVTEYVKKICKENLLNIQGTLGEIEKKQVSILKQIKLELAKLKKEVSEYKSHYEKLDETILYTMHAVKKNQFLYSHYPDEWAKNYEEMKKGLIEENNYLDEKCEEKRNLQKRKKVYIG